jgi:hypothetical protein
MKSDSSQQMQNEAEMSNEKILEAMRVLSQDKDQKNRSAISRLRGNFDAIEIALKNGVKRKAIWEEFIKEGYAIPLKTFESAIYRISKERSKSRKPLSSSSSNSLPEKPATKTGFHQVVEQLASKNSSEDPRRN